MKKNPNKNYASIDLGTNSARLLIVDSKNKPVCIASQKVMIGEGMFLENTFSNKAIDRTIKAFCEFSQIIKENDVCQVRAVGTAACRTAKNIDILIDKIKEKSGINLEVISGEEEAYLTTLGASTVLKEKSENTIFCDIGGGSTEMIFTNKNMEIIDSISLAFGGRNLSEILDIKSFDGKVISKIDQLIEPKIADFFQRNDIKNQISNTSFIGISGAILRIASITNNTDEYDREKAHGLIFSKDKFDNFLNSYIKMDTKTLEQSKYIGEDKAITLMTASIIFSKVLELSGAKEVVASLAGVKEGVVKSLIDDNITNLDLYHSNLFNLHQTSNHR